MSRTQFQTLAVAVVLVGGSSLWLSKSTAPGRASARAEFEGESARQAYQAFDTMYAVGQATPEDVYRWSRRLMGAETEADPANKQPAEDPRNRMRTLQRRISALNGAGAEGGEECHLAAANYYVGRGRG
jgi:hypothetical protein